MSINREIPVAKGKRLVPSVVFDTFWRFAAERQRVFLQRVSGAGPPWTRDPILGSHRFTNVFRASDRVSQYLIRNVIYAGSQEPEEVFFRTLLFKVFNKTSTWELLAARLGALPSWRSFDFDVYADALDQAMSAGQQVYSAAYIMPSPSFGNSRKHRNHLRLLEHMMATLAPLRVARSRTLEQVYQTLLGYRSIGPFLAFQFSIDLNYSDHIDFSEMDFVVAGPGARDGIRKCFLDTAGYDHADLIRIVTERADEEFASAGLVFDGLWGRPLQLIDCQNLFCEVSKYARVSHPTVVGETSRTRIKQKFVPVSATLPQWYPPKWGLEAISSAPPGPPGCSPEHSCRAAAIGAG